MPASGAATSAPTMLIDMKSEVSSSETAKRSSTSSRSTGTGMVTGAMIPSASSPRAARRHDAPGAAFSAGSND